MARDGPGISRILHPGDLEALAEAAQVDAVHHAVAGITKGFLQRVDGSDCPGANRRAEELRPGERRAAGDERLAEAAGHVVVERQQALDVRHGHLGGEVAQIDRSRCSLEAKRERRVDGDRGVVCVVTFAPYATASACATSTAFAVIWPRARTWSAE